MQRPMVWWPKKCFVGRTQASPAQKREMGAGSRKLPPVPCVQEGRSCRPDQLSEATLTFPHTLAQMSLKCHSINSILVWHLIMQNFLIFPMHASTLYRPDSDLPSPCHPQKPGQHPSHLSDCEQAKSVHVRLPRRGLHAAAT